MQKWGKLKYFTKLVKKIEICKQGAWKSLWKVGAALAGREVIVEDDCGGNFIDEFLVATCHTPEAAVDHRTVGERGRKALIETLHCHIGHLTPKML